MRTTTANDGSRSGSKRRIRIFVLYRGDTGGGNQTRHRQPCARALSQEARQQQAQPQTQQANAAPVSNPQPAATSTQTAAREPSATTDNAFARARDPDVKRELRRAEEQRKAERRQQWVEKRRYRGRGDDELRDVELKVREETGSPRSFAAEPVRIETPRIRLFGDED